jgi:hypothetical protein
MISAGKSDWVLDTLLEDKLLEQVFLLSAL